MGKSDDRIAEVASALSYSPENRTLFDRFDAQYRRLSGNSEEVREAYRDLYLIARCFNEPSADTYREVADYFIEREGSEFLCYLCDLSVLRLNPFDEETYKRATSYARTFIEKGGEAIEMQSENECAVTVIMPTYNRGGVIEESIKSVLEQDFEDFELIIVNDGGDDRAKPVIDELNDGRIRYFKIEHAGLSGALNAGLKAARGEYIAYLDDDDAYYGNHLSTLIRVARERGRDFVYSKSKVIYGGRDDDGGFIPVKDAGTFTLRYAKSTLAMNLGISVLNVLHKRELVRKVGLFNVELPCSMDWDYWMRLSDIVEPYFVDCWGGEYRRTLDNMSSLNVYRGRFCMDHLLAPYFSTAYGAFTLYGSASLQSDEEKDFWAERLSKHFISQQELLKAVFSSRKLAFDLGMISKSLIRNKYRGEFSFVSFGMFLVRRLARRMGYI